MPNPLAGEGALLATLEHLLALPVASLSDALTHSSQLLADVFEIEKVDAWFLDPEARLFVVLGVSNTPLGRRQRELGLDRLAFDETSIIRHVYETGSPYLTNDTKRDGYIHPRMRDELGIRSSLGIPMHVNEQQRGVLLMADTRHDRFSSEHTEYLATVGRWVGLVAHRAELMATQATLDAERATSSRLARLQTVTAALAVAPRRAEVVDAVLQQGVAASGAAAGSVYELTDARGERELALIAHTGYPDGSHDQYTYLALDAPVAAADAVRTGTPVFLESARQMQERYPEGAALHASLGFAAAAALPLVAGGRTLGALAISFRDMHRFDSDERELIMTVADQSALALDRAQLYESEHRARADAESSVRARDEFLSIASHELRNPLATLKGRLDLLLRQARRDRLDLEQLPRQIEAASAAAARLGRLIDDLLDVSRLRTGQMPLVPSDIDLVRLVRDATERVATTHGPRHHLRLEVDCDACVVRGDPDRLEQVLANLLENAFKYSPEGGTVLVELITGDRGVLVRVTDEGIGLPAGAAELIFEPFGRAPNASARNIPGMGLGLYVSRQIATAHGGRLWAESRGEGQGTAFSLWLPAGDRDLGVGE